MARRFTIEEWQNRLNEIQQPLVIVGKYRQKESKKEIFTIQCYKCGGIFEATRYSIRSACDSRMQNPQISNWCPICHGSQIIRGINDVASLRPDLVKYFVNQEEAQKYGTGNPARVQLRCLECGQVKQARIADLCRYGFHCDYCNDNVSLGEKIVRNLILQLPIDEFDYEFVDAWTQNKRYDAYFLYRKVKYLIEIDGEQHIKNTSWSTEEWQGENDLLKTDLALKNGFRLIRIKAYKTNFEYIKKNILNSELSKIFDLSHIDWDIICKQTVTSRNLEIAKYYQEHEGIMIKEIASYFHVSTPTVTSSLRKLSMVGLCDYSKEKAFANGRKRNGQNMVGKKRKESDLYACHW